MFTGLGISCTILMAVLPGTIYYIHKKITMYGAQPWNTDVQKKKPE
ncbi:hypothetical protein ACS47_23460 [Bacillus cereus]|uniref:Uncharacterized protein n=2 Tax=Bacillus cereus group TaxID=86661 RepID=A0ABT6DYX3_9BACI|nr:MULTISPECIES: hypothetical protein [Bacillus]ACJ79435.1 hypothetical protein BCAH187_A0840 [Bacillus cereus AH187]EEL02182.1 hypothetical protein bcere0013_6440 [Bacillus cereus BDRD-ST26]KLA06980.1 hypothetical protein B4153_0695 [Bacillus cereus]MCD9104184.1 hypothetical protein [Bacillus sp. PLB03]MCU5225819.1 hypothetical protein [Bacillus tropicus]MDA1539151.1 hypothetical protein [Bacillus cereus group sp. TH244-1LC]PES22121.1 hypothetical protein CN488_15115 [Bacillus anthracis]BA